MSVATSGRIGTIRHVLDVLHEPGSVIEIRALGVPGKGKPHTVAGYFDDFGAAAEAVARLDDRKPAGIYQTLNAIATALLARSPNKLVDYLEPLTSDSDTDVVRRRWLLLDFDPRRPTGVPSTDAEHQAAREAAAWCRQWLESLGWPAPIFASSGNGYHLLYRIDLPNDQESANLVQNVLEAVAAGVARRGTDGPAVDLDRKVFNAARIGRLYGTTARKGHALDDRPHRVSGLVEVPDPVEVVPVELLQGLAGTAAKPRPAQPTRADRDGHDGPPPRLDVAAWLNARGMPFKVKERPDRHGRKVFLLERCPFDEAHGHRGEVSIMQGPDGKLGAACMHNSCSGKGWQDFKAAIGKPDANHYDPPLRPDGEGDHRPYDETEAPFGSERVPDRGKPATERKRSQATTLVELAVQAGCELWHNPDGDAYASIPVDAHREHWRIRSTPFRRWLARQYYLASRSAPGGQAQQDAIGVLEGKALFDGNEHTAFVRVGELGGNIYIDLRNPAWQAVEVTPRGWRVVENPPVRFRRAKAMLPLPVPVIGGCIGDLRQFVNITDSEWPLFLAALVAAYRPTGPYPVLNLHGEQGSSKTTTARVFRSLIDPNTAPVRAEPREPRDLMIAACNGWVVALDNLSYLPTWLSDALCRLSTGGGFSTRTLYENDEETIFDAQRPVIITGIEEAASRSDLLDRSIMVTLPTIPESRRRAESGFWEAFSKAQPSLFGVLLTAVSAAMRNLPTTTIERLPRMADFSLWAVASEPALALQRGAFMAAYSENRTASNELALEGSPVAKVLLEMLTATEVWTGTASELLDELDQRTDEKTRRQKSWPQSPRVLSGIIKRLAPNLRAMGLQVEFGHSGRGKSKRRSITIGRVREFIVPSVPTVPNPGNPRPTGDDGDTTEVDGDAMGAQAGYAPSPSQATTGTHGDGGDADSLPCSNGDHDLTPEDEAS